MNGGIDLEDENMVTPAERSTYGLYYVGQNIFYILLMTYLTVFFTDVGIPAATVAIIALVVKMWDAVNDPIFGGIVDNIKLKGGKFLPWIRISVFAIPLATIFLFAIPIELSLGAKIAWATIGYILWDTAYTLCDVPIFGIVGSMTSNVRERIDLVSLGRVAALMASLLIALLIPTIRKQLGGWLPTTVALSFVAAITMAPICFAAKERVPDNSPGKVSMKEMFSFVLGNKYMLFIFGAYILFGATHIGSGLGLYSARYLFGQERMQSIMTMAKLVPMIIVSAATPALARKIDKYWLYFWSFVIIIPLHLIWFFAGYSNVTVYLFMIVLTSIPSGFIMTLSFMFTPDCAEYGLYKTGISATGLSYSIQTFSTKLNQALMTAIGAFMLFLMGFVEGERAVQVSSFASNLFSATTLFPILGSLLAIPLLYRYRLRDKYVQALIKCNDGEVSREETEKELEGRI
jgi:probable glucitol transport protein GutA